MSEIIEKETTKQAIKPPAMWNVIFINDDYTTFDFVIACLKYVFGKSEEQGYIIAKSVNDTGKGIVGQYTRDIALTKQLMAQEFAQQEGHPLKIEIEPA